MQISDLYIPESYKTPVKNGCGGVVGCERYGAVIQGVNIDRRGRNPTIQ